MPCSPHYTYFTIGRTLMNEKKLFLPAKYQEHQEKVCDKLRAWQYPKWTINRVISQVAYIPRENVLKKRYQRSFKDDRTDVVIFTTPYSPQFKQKVGALLSPSLFLMSDHPKPNRLTSKGSFGCGHKVCTACKFAKNTCSFFSLRKIHDLCNHMCVILNTICRMYNQSPKNWDTQTSSRFT